ncbi:sec-independent protein translocase protein TatB [Krasilnikovia cinnamomea]|uniref:Sec-independent protein translocase protein TatB n=1 Tax=Krasilnikovia cinnamomea TaxID=349313 RepID=A0A4Q7ZHT9_9ACTN|nr:preprotein translocase subunit TatB [Krasilnikovia cinnamomea]RZU50378.1 sec-independent protein translocase protein TatB [Krasilnikovia cinnamomea]
MFENLNWWEILALLMLALLIFGERLPKVIGDGLRMLRGLRSMAQNATTDLSRELGTDIQLQDLHPKAFIRKHLLSEDEEAALRKPLQGLFDDVKSDLNGVKSGINGLKSDLTDVKSWQSDPAPGAAVAPEQSRPVADRFDVDAT